MRLSVCLSIARNQWSNSYQIWHSDCLNHENASHVNDIMTVKVSQILIMKIMNARLFQKLVGQAMPIKFAVKIVRPVLYVGQSDDLDLHSVTTVSTYGIQTWHDGRVTHGIWYNAHSNSLQFETFLRLVFMFVLIASIVNDILIRYFVDQVLDNGFCCFCPKWQMIVLYRCLLLIKKDIFTFD